MNTKAKNWTKSTVTLLTMILLVWLLPDSPVDPWKILNLKKVATMIFAITLIQVIGSTIVQIFGARMGAIVTGFFGGLISSTATTAALARRSKVSIQNEASSEILIFLSATGAMLFEGMFILCMGTNEIHLLLLLVFAVPIITTVSMILVQSRKFQDQNLELESTQFEVLPILKLSGFIIAILAMSKILQNFFGKNGLLVLTFLVSLFEIHGSVIANVQLHDANAVSVRLLGTLLVVSIFASYLSKIFLITTLGSISLKKSAIKCTFLLFFSLIVSWAVFLFFV